MDFLQFSKFVSSECDHTWEHPDSWWWCWWSSRVNRAQKSISSCYLGEFLRVWFIQIPFSPVTAYHDSGWLTHPVELLIYCQVKWKLYKSLLLLVVNNTVCRIVCHITGFNEERPSDVVECHLFTCILTQRCLLTRDCVLQRLQRYCEEVQPSVKWW